jgi:cytochrome P450
MDLFSAGTETSSTTLLWALLYIAKFPDIQKKLQDEVDSVIGREKPPGRMDKKKYVLIDISFRLNYETKQNRMILIYMYMLIFKIVYRIWRLLQMKCTGIRLFFQSAFFIQC